MYQIRYDSKRVQKGLKKLPVKEQERIIKCIENRLINFRTRTKGIRRIKTTGEYRLRQGDYRILFIVEDDTILIKKIQNRKDVYR